MELINFLISSSFFILFTLKYLLNFVKGFGFIKIVDAIFYKIKSSLVSFDVIINDIK